MIASAVMAVLFVACRDRATQAPAQRSGYVVDSILPPGEALRRFRAGLDSPRALAGPTSRDSLVHSFFVGVRNRDRPALESLAVTRAEFAWLIFPQSRWSSSPYRQPPDVAWMLLRANSDGGLTKLLNRAGDLHLYSYTCPDSAEREGHMRLWPRCVVHLRDGIQQRSLRLFGTIVELGGRYKFAGYANSF